MDAAFYSMRIATIDEEAKRSRWIPIVSTIASIAIIGSSWNAFHIGLFDVASSLWQAGAFAADQPTQELQKALLKAWVDGMFVNITALGIRFSISAHGFSAVLRFRGTDKDTLVYTKQYLLKLGYAY
jgi:hypothetical protein